MAAGSSELCSEVHLLIGLAYVGQMNYVPVRNSLDTVSCLLFILSWVDERREDEMQVCFVKSLPDLIGYATQMQSLNLDRP